MSKDDVAEFQRERRYFVAKLKHLTPSQVMALDAIARAWGVPETEAVVIESDWPIYDDAWRLVEKQWRSAHEPAPVDPLWPIVEQSLAAANGCIELEHIDQLTTELRARGVTLTNAGTMKEGE